MLIFNRWRKGNESVTPDCFVLLNSSCSYLYSSTVVYASLITAAAAVVSFTVCGNLLVIISVCHFRQLHTPTNILILSLAIADVLVGVFGMPVHFIFLIEPCLLFEPYICAVYNMIAYNLTSVSIYTVSFISIDRYFALSNPFLYIKKVSVSVVSIVVLLIWVLSLCHNSALLYFSGDFTKKCPSRCTVAVNELWSFLDLILVFVLPCATMLTLYIRIFFIAKRHAVKIRVAFKRGKQAKNNNVAKRSERKAAKVLGIIVSVFLACLAPYYLCSLLIDMLPSSFETVLTQILTLLYLNSTMNPVIYALFYRWFQKSIKIIVTFRICATDSSLIDVLSGSS